MSYRLYTTEAFILKNKSLGEADKNYSLLTRDLGIIAAFAKGAGYEKSKLNPFLQDLSLSRVTLIRGKNFWRVTGASLVKNYFSQLKENKNKLSGLMRVLNLIVQFAGEERNVKLFDLVKDATDFFSAENLDKNEISIFESVLALRVLNNLGYVAKTPQFESILLGNWHEAMSSGKKFKGKIILAVNKALKESHL